MNVPRRRPAPHRLLSGVVEGVASAAVFQGEDWRYHQQQTKNSCVANVAVDSDGLEDVVNAA